MELTAKIFLALLAPVAMELFRFIISKYQVRVANRKTKREEFNQALESDDLKTIGNYLRGHLGYVPVAAYAGNKAARRRVDKYIDRILRFVDGEPVMESHAVDGDGVLRSESTVPESDTKRVADVTKLASERVNDPEIIKEALRDLADGNTWGALAKLRRDVELRFRSLADTDRFVSPTQLAATLKFPPSVQVDLRAFYRIASAAVHGIEVGFDEAVQAIDHARHVYRHLELKGGRRPPEPAD